nr:uncharacterized protein LOC110438362 [Danio rerio]|eukprot:XP_021326071.1 uncharacterized protein LOC110438362 [Danio rerio]
MAEAEEVSETTQELSLVCPSDIVFCDSGEDVVLLCRLDPSISAVSMEIMWKNKADLICHYKNERVIENYEGRVSLSVDELCNGNVSLTLRDIRRSQRGLYICEVIHRCQTLKEYIFLNISSEDFNIVVPTDPVIADPGDDVTLPVHLSPETSALSMTIRWYRETELIYHFKSGQEETHGAYESRVSLSIQQLRRGNVSLTLRNVQQSDSGDYTCKVSHEGCLQRGKVHLQVTELEMCENLSKYRPMPEVEQLLQRILPFDHDSLTLIKSVKGLLDEVEQIIDFGDSTYSHIIRQRLHPSIVDEDVRRRWKELMEIFRQSQEHLRHLMFLSHPTTEVDEDVRRRWKELMEIIRQFQEHLRHLMFLSHPTTEVDEDVRRRWKELMEIFRQSQEHLRHLMFLSHPTTEVDADVRRRWMEIMEIFRQSQEHLRHLMFLSHPTTEGSTPRRRNSTEGLRPYMDEENASQQIESMRRQMTAVVLSQRAGAQIEGVAEATTQMVQERRQESIAIEQQRSPLELYRPSLYSIMLIDLDLRQDNVTWPAVQSQVHERERTPESATRSRRRERSKDKKQDESK